MERPQHDTKILEKTWLWTEEEKSLLKISVNFVIDFENCSHLSQILTLDWLYLISVLKNQRRWKEIATLADYATIGDSVSLAKIGDKAFTITFIEDSDYTQGGEVTKGVKITTKESFEVDGNFINKFHTTRVAIVKKFNNEKLRNDVNGGNHLGPVKCIVEKPTSGKNFYNLVDA